jgi:hypothetical protein
MKAESQAVLDTLTEHDFQNVFNKYEKYWEQCMSVEVDYFKVNNDQ